MSVLDIPAAQTQRSGNVPIAFSGTGWQYFKIFVANTLLTIVTLGIYSAWARVRTRRFFMGHTFIGRHNLEFDARPLSILFSRILVVVVLGGLSFVENNYELIWSGVGIGLIGILLLMPIALVRGRAFVARHTIHRTVRFHYRIEYLRPVMLFMGYGLFIIPITYAGFQLGELENEAYAGMMGASVLGFMLALPLLLHFDHRIQISQLQFGKLRLYYEGGFGRYYGAVLKSFGMSILASLFTGFILVALQLALTGSIESPEEPPVLLAILSSVLLLFLFAYSFALYRSALTCVYWKSFRVGEDSVLESDVEWRPYAWVLAVNYTAIVLSLGLLYPWARVRAYRYVAERLQIRLGPNTAAEYSAAGDELTPLAGEFADVAGWDFDFGAV